MEKLIKSRLIQHMLFWLFFAITLYGHFLGEFKLHDSLFSDSKYLFIICFSSYVGFVYLNLDIFIPTFFVKKRYLEYFTVTILVGCAINALTYLFAYLIVSHHDFEINFLQWFLYNLFFGFFLIILSSFLHFIKEWSLVNEKNLTSQKEKISAELEALKAQINPHFLFNMLNNIYSLSLEKSEKVPDLILRLSDLMNYVLYDCKSEFVPLAMEVDFIKSYIELEKLRFVETVEINSTFEREFGSYSIAPLLLLPFVDNAFKHSQTTGDQRKINISLKINENKAMTFDVDNTFDPECSVQRENGGIGVNNVMKRLEYLYPGKYKVTIVSEGNVYTVKLILDLQ